MKTDPKCPNCHGTGVDLGDAGGLARFVQACHCVEGGDFDGRELWAVQQVLVWRQERGDRLKIERLGKVRQRLLGKKVRTEQEEAQLQEVADALRPLLDRVGSTPEESDMNQRMREFVRSRVGGVI